MQGAGLMVAFRPGSLLEVSQCQDPQVLGFRVYGFMDFKP